jgi:hypothetical protein
MDLKIKIKTLLREIYGDFISDLEHEYEDKLTENLINGDLEKKKRWLTYNQVIIELKNTIKDNVKVKELQYKLTDDTNPNDVCIEIIEGVGERSPELERLYEKIKNF